MEKKLDSWVMKVGVIRNGTIIIVCYTLYYFIPDEYVMPGDLVISGFAIATIISLFENMKKMGIKVPVSITERLNITREERDDPNNPEP